MATYVIADIHAHVIPLRAILAHINLQPADTLVTLGDYIDRGPDSKAVLDTLIALHPKCTLIPLLGNHEEMMLNTRQVSLKGGDPRMVAEWLMNGGDAALNSYLPNATAAEAFAAIPPNHWLFLDSCRNYYETPTHIFAHAQPDPHLPLDKQDPHTLRWQRFNDPPPHISGKPVICGHTPQRNGFPRHIGHATCLDTGIHVGRHLTCLHVDTGKIIQSDQNGNIRTSHLNDHLVKPHPM